MSSNNKTLYKLEIWSTKYLPIIIAILYVLGSLTSYFDYNISEFAIIGGLSFLPLGKLFLDSFTYKLCFHHRIFLYYITIQNILNWIDHFIDNYISEGGIPIPERTFLTLDVVLFGISLFLYIIFKRKYDFSRKYSSKVS